MLNIPEDKLPGYAKDEERLSALFAPIRSQAVNPKDWESKIISWKDLIYLYCESNAIYTVTLSSLNMAFIRHGRPPPCLNEVVSNMVKTGELVPLNEFLKKAPQSWSGWAADLILKKPLNWGLNTLKKSIFTQTEEMYVHLGVVKSDAKKFFSEYPERYRNKLVDFDKVLEVMALPASQGSGIKLLVHYLETIGKARCVNLNCANKIVFLVKMGDFEGTKEVTELDIGKYTAHRNEKCFEKHVEIIEDEINKYVQEAKLHLVKGQRNLAKTALRKKHEAEKRLEHKLNALHNIQAIRQKIEDAELDAQVFKSYQGAIEALNSVFKEKGLNEDAVEDTMIQMRDTLEMHDDIGKLISEPIVQENDSDIERELAELLEADKEENNSAVMKTDPELEEAMRRLDISNLPEISSPEKAKNTKLSLN